MTGRRRGEDHVHMPFQSYNELITPDERSLRFTPQGLSLDGALAPQRAAEYQQQLIADCDLDQAVPDATQRAFERIRALHAHGLFLYDAYTIAYDLCGLTLELALRERLLAWHLEQPITLKHASGGHEVPLIASVWDDVDHSLRKGAHKRGPWVIDTPDGEVPFAGNVKGLLVWARAVGLLPGRRSRALDTILHSQRIRAGHISYHLVMPVDSVRAIRQLAEIINQLWGHPTHGGRLFPSPVAREPIAIAWTENPPSGLTQATREQVANWQDPDGHLCVVVLAVPGDPGLWQYDNWHEQTDYPADLLWGPGTVTDAKAWLDQHDVAGDTVQPLDRLFAVRHDDDHVDQPVRSEVATVLPSAMRTGLWTLVRADRPVDAFAHANHVRAGLRCISSTAARVQAGDAVECTSEHLYHGDHAGLVEHLGTRQEVPTIALPPHVRVPSIWGD